MSWRKKKKKKDEKPARKKWDLSSDDDEDNDGGGAAADDGAAGMDCVTCKAAGRPAEPDVFCLGCKSYFKLKCFTEKHTPTRTTPDAPDLSLHRFRPMLGLTPQQLEGLDVGWQVGEERTQQQKAAERAKKKRKREAAEEETRKRKEAYKKQRAEEAKKSEFDAQFVSSNHYGGAIESDDPSTVLSTKPMRLTKKAEALVAAGHLPPPRRGSLWKGRGREDWTCPNCGASCFGSKSECFKCGTRRPPSHSRQRR